MAFCYKCGTELADGASFCGACGAANTKTESANTTNAADLASPSRADFVGKNYDYYQRKWEIADSRDQLSGFSPDAIKRRFKMWNWAAFLFSAWWFAFRKMYLYPSIIIAISLVETISVWGFGTPEIPLLFSTLFYLLLNFLFGLYGNALYGEHVDREIQKITASHQGDYAQLKEKLTKRGGTSALAVMGFLILSILIRMPVVSNDLSEQLHKSDQPVTATNEPPPVSQAMLGQTFQTGEFEIKIANVVAQNAVGGVNVVGQIIGQSVAPNGATYVIVNWTYKNITGQPINPTSQPKVQLVDRNGQRYNPDVAASAAYASQAGNDKKILSDLNPGVTLTANDVFEISRESAQQGGWSVLAVADREITVALQPTASKQAEPPKNAGPNPATSSPSQSGLPFIGSRHFNFFGGSGTGYEIEIGSNGKCKVTLNGTSDSTVLYEGVFSNPLHLPDYLLYIEGNHIYSLDKEGNVQNDCRDGKPCVSELY